MEPPALLALALGTLGVIAALPAPPSLSVSLSVPSILEQGMPFDITCNTSVTADLVTVTADGQTFPASLSRDGHQATATVTVNRTGSVPVGCTVRAGDRAGNASRNVHVLYIPEPTLTVTTRRPPAGTELTGRCSLPPDATRDIQVRVMANGTVLVGWGQPPLTFALPVGHREEDKEDEEEKEGLELLCQAELLDRVRNSSVWITVLVKPRLDPAGCPAQQNWTEGRQETLHCRARGRPQPQINCSKDGRALEAGSPHRAHRDHAGTYRCRATNELGTAESNVTLRVHYEDSIPVLPLLLGTLLPALTLLILAGLYLLHRHNTKIGTYWLWRR